MFRLASPAELTCSAASFPGTRGRALSQVNPSQLLCARPNLSRNCASYLDRAAARTIINCSGRNLTAFPDLALDRESDTISLFLDNNNLTDEAIANASHLPNYQNISNLSLSNNRIETFSPQTFPGNLTFLTLDNNRIARISDSALHWLDRQARRGKLQLLRLGGNRYAGT